jgi:hypothetical protein
MIPKVDHRIRAILILVIFTMLGVMSAKEFGAMHVPDVLYPGDGVTGQGKLSDYFPALKGTPGDTDIYFLKGAQPGGKFLVLGGTHNDEASGQLTAITLIENAIVTQGELIVIPRANNSGASYVQEMIGIPQFIELNTSKGERRIRTGSRYTNPAHEFPDPNVYQNARGAAYPGTESRNLNRVYPGKPDGYLMEQVAFGLIKFMNDEKIDVLLDLHEAVPEHYVVNCMVGHNRAMELVTVTLMELQMKGIDIKMYESPGVYGFSHRDIGDNTDAYVALAETTDILQGAFRGKPTQKLLKDGKDPFYDILSAKGKVFVDYDSDTGATLSDRVGRHLSTVIEMSRALAYTDPDKPVVITNVPEYEEMLANGIEMYLEPGS